jgi:cobalt-zinc-cadmium efflux system protein
MSHASHKHDHGNRNIVATILLNIIITVAQIVGGLISGSMALLSDAAHNFSDVISLMISYIAAQLSGRKQTLRQTYGFKRAGIFAAFINTATLLVIAAILIWEAVTRFIHPEPVTADIVILLAGAGIVLNGLSLLFIRKEASTSMNIRSAYIHLFMDMITSVAVLAGGLVIKYTGWSRIDSILTVVIAIYFLYSSWGIFYESVRIFMQFTPTSINIEEIAVEINSLEGVRNMHHVHVWQLDDREMMLEAHIDLEDDYTISHFETILEEVEFILARFNIHHFNIQPELHRDDIKELIHTGGHHR